MKQNTRKILLGLSLLGVTMTSLSTSASAAPKDRDVREARKEVKEARRDLRRANTPEERRDAREDLREEQRDLREERRENRPGYPGYVRPTYGRPGYVRPGYSRPGYVRPGNGSFRPGYGSSNVVRPGYGRPGYSANNRTLQGVVTSDLDGNDFVIRANNGQTVRVIAVNGESGRISRGDTVSVSGSYSGSTFRANNVSILRNR